MFIENPSTPGMVYVMGIKKGFEALNEMARNMLGLYINDRGNILNMP
jgi:hypothetical protein